MITIWRQSDGQVVYSFQSQVISVSEVLLALENIKLQLLGVKRSDQVPGFAPRRVP